MLKKITLLRDRVEDWDSYPFTVPVIRNLETLSFTSRITFFAGENGTGKSTLLEAIAAHYGFGKEGGNRNFSVNTTSSNNSPDPLTRVLRLSFDKRTGKGFFFRAESFFNTATYVDQIEAEELYGGKSLHECSHGESFLTLLDEKFRRNGLFLLDEPEAALSPQRQLAFLNSKTLNSSFPATLRSCSVIRKLRSFPSIARNFRVSLMKTFRQFKLLAAS